MTAEKYKHRSRSNEGSDSRGVPVRRHVRIFALRGRRISMDSGPYFSLPYLPAATISYSIGLLVGYVLSVTAVFKYRRLKSQPLEFVGFAMVGVIGLAINAAAMAFGVGYLGEHYLTAKCGAAALTFVWNFSVRRQLLFALPRAST